MLPHSVFAGTAGGTSSVMPPLPTRGNIAHPTLRRPFWNVCTVPLRPLRTISTTQYLDNLQHSMYYLFNTQPKHATLPPEQKVQSTAI
jgi:hypothetical protein